jgi:transcription-repair coupling factor (superfamily II helicase)
VSPAIREAPTTSPARGTRDLTRALLDQDAFAEVVRALRRGESATLGGAWGASRALVAAALAGASPGSLVVVCPHLADVDHLVDALPLFDAATHEVFPAEEGGPAERLADEIAGVRLRVLKRLASDAPPRILATSIQALLQPVPSVDEIARGTRQIRVGETVSPDDFAHWLVEHGFESTTAIAMPGEFARRGGILDVFALDWENPVRIELFGDEIESLREFDVQSQRSIQSLDAADITPPGHGRPPTAHLADHLPGDAWVLLIEPAELDQEGQSFLARLDDSQPAHPLASTFASIGRFPSVAAAGIPAGTFDTSAHLPIESVERFSGSIDRVRGEIDSLGEDQHVFLVCETDAEAERLAEIFRETRLAAEGRLHFEIGRLHGGFRFPPLGVAVISGAELFGRQEVARVSQRRLGRAIDSFLELREGDLVVHVAHGIARYRGLAVLEKEGRVEEHLELEFHGGTKIFVPASKIELVQKYVGGSKARPTLARIGGKSWVRQKEAAESAATDLAAEFLELQATRRTRAGIAFPPDTEWQREFDAAFPFQETPDQLAAVQAIKQDMQRPQPMDRLLCGDVGFGKTELAMRAAFKAVDAGYQVAVLVPTTILAEQHFRTFRQRMAEFPFEIAVLSRFCTDKEQRETVRRLAEGSIDIVIGTHRLAQRDVDFANLGLIIIDEEQRFGVAVKERLKAVRATVDVLTMTATPIPRTLHFSLLGIRDISNLQTPPEDRLAIETRVARFDEDLIRHAILRELNREGQIFFVHNRVHDIEKIAARLGRIVPEATIAIGHGQMPEGELARVMIDFLDRRTDILLATTIVESGLDIPNANTMFIDDADRYGLADLHQLRGRVGRYKHRAYCYLLIDENRHLSPESARRLRAIEEFREIGAGFALSMRDLELRGAGNILGTEQSGHIATVGYELYCTLLENAVRRLKHMPPRTTVDVTIDLPGAAYLPPSYVPDMRLKIDLYRRAARLATFEELRDFERELIDRFGPPPAVVRQMVELAELRLLAHQWGIAAIDVEDRFVVLHYTSSRLIKELAKRTGRVRIADAESAYVPVGRDAVADGECVGIIKGLLEGGKSGTVGL